MIAHKILKSLFLAFGIILATVSGAGEVLAQAGELITVRAIEAGASNRLTFYFRSDVGYQATVGEGQIVINFAEPMFIDFGSLSATALSYVSNPTFQNDGTLTTVTLDIVRGALVNHYKDGNRLIVDIAAPPAAQSASAGQTAPAVQTAEAEQPRSDETDTAPSPDAAATPLAAEVAQNTADQGADVSILLTSIQGDGDTLTMVFAWRYAVGAAVFNRAGYLWIVFDEAVDTDLAFVQPYLNDQIVSAQQARGPEQTTFRFALKDGLVANARRQDNTWLVQLGAAGSEEPLAAIALARQETADDSFRIFIPLQEPGPHLRIEDPDVGDVLDVIPVGSSGVGAATQRDFAQFQILKSAQGLVVARGSDQVVVTRFSNGVAIGSVIRLAISDSPLDNELALRAARRPDDLQPARLVDFEAWRMGGLIDYIDNQQALLLASASADASTINDRRWDMARFFLGHGMASEALAMLELMGEHDPEILTDPKYRAISGIALIYERDFEAAERQIAARELDAEQDIYLWRALVQEGLGNYEESLDLFERGREALQYYDEQKVSGFRISVVRSALAIGRFDTANWQISLLRRANLDDYQRAEVDYLEGRLLEEMGDTVEAMAYYMGVDEFANRKAAARARYALAISRLDRGEITADEAILEMERLRYSWRGDLFEQELLHRLGVLYLDKGSHRQGLETLRQAVASFPENNATRAMAAEMVKRFRELFLEGEADELPAITALALFYDYRELTPLGQEGDQMIRRLADRLVSVDLLKRAAELLEHQVRFRLVGAAQSLIAGRLAKIYLMDRNPDAALQIIRATRQQDMTDDILSERLLIEARALTELQRFEEAEVLLENASGDDVDSLLADIYWGSQNWDGVVNATRRILGERYNSAEPLDEGERQYLIRQVIAMSLAGRAADLALVKQQYEHLMQEGLLATAFDVITNPAEYSTVEIREAVRVTAAVDTFQSFMSSYRQEFLADRDENSLP
jgi:hypothetical protein